MVPSCCRFHLLPAAAAPPAPRPGSAEAGGAALAAVAVVSWLASQLRRRRPQGHSQLRLLRYRQLMLYQHWRLRLRFQWLLTFSRTQMSAKKVQQA